MELNSDISEIRLDLTGSTNSQPSIRKSWQASVKC